MRNSDKMVFAALIVPYVTRLLFFILSVMVMFQQPVFAQTLSIRIYNVEKGLAQSQVQNIVQDREGYLWFGTADGLSRFDGYSFVTFTKKDGLAENDVTASCLDRSGNLWFGHRNGTISIYKIQTHTFEKFQPEGQLPDKRIQMIFRDRKENLWFATLGSGVFKYDGKKLISLTEADGLISNNVYAICETKHGDLWFGSRKGITIYVESEGLTRPKFSYLTSSDGLPSNQITTLVADTSGNIWIGTRDAGLIKYIYSESNNRGKSSFEFYSIENGLPDNSIRSIYKDSTGNIWIGTFGGGVSEYILSLPAERRFTPEKGGKRFRTISTQNGLSHNHVVSILQDREGNMWFGTWGGGVNQYTDRRFEVYGKKEGLIHEIVWAILEDSHGNYWFGTEKGVTRLTPIKTRESKVRVKHYTTADGLSRNFVLAIYEDGEGNLWFGTYGGGVCRLDPTTDKIKVYTEKDGLAEDYVLSIRTDDKGYLWFGTYRGGVSRYDPVRGTFQNYTESDGLGSNHVNYIIKDHKGNMWFALENRGITRFDGEKFYNIDRGSEPAFYTSNTITEDNEGNIWIGTPGEGLFKFDGSTFQNYTTDDGLSGDNIYSLIFDDENNLWIGTSKGIDKFNPQEGTFVHYGKQDGFLGIETNQNAIFKDHHGNLWFGTIAGAIKYNPTEEKRNLVPPLAHITKVRLFLKDAPVPADARFSYDKNHLTFHFVGLSFRVPGKIKYKYFLEGFDKDWSPVTTERYATYSNLPPGQYAFKVLACNNDGLWNSEPAVYRFEILAPLWQTWWFYSLIIILFSVSIFLIHKYHVRKIERERTILEFRVNERTRQLVEEKEKVERAYRALRESEEKFRAVTETTASAIFIYQDQRIIYVNPACQKVTGYTQEELMKMNFWDIAHPDFKEIIKKQGMARLQGKVVPPRYEVKIITKSGEERWIDFTGRNIEYDGRPAVLGTAFDVTERKLAERALQESEEKYRKLIESANDAIFVTEAETGVIIDVNKRAEELVGISAKNIIGMHYSKLHPKEEAERYRHIFAEFIRSGRVVMENLYIQHKDGRKIPVDVSVSVTELKGRKVIQEIVRDITERKKVEEALRVNEERYRAVVEQSAEIIFLVDIDTRKIIEANTTFQTILGYGLREIKKLTLYDFVASDRASIDKNIQEILKQKRLYIGERQYRKKDGSLVDVEVNTSIITYGGKQILSIVSRDITERKRAEEALLAEKERLAVTLRSIGDGVISTTTAGEIVLMNEVAEELTGWTQDEAMGKFLSEVFRIIDDKSRQSCEDPVETVMRTGDVVGFRDHTTLVSRKGNERFISYSGAPIRDKNGKIIGVVLVFRDVTERKKLEEEVLKAQKLESVGVLAGGIAHDFNNILTAILGNLSLAKMYTRPGEKIYDRLQIAEKASIRAQELTQQLLTFSKGGAPIKKTTSIVDLIKDSASFVLRGSNVRCDYEISEELWPVEVDPGQISQVIQNLIINSNQAMPEGGTIKVQAENVIVDSRSGLPMEPGKYVKIVVKDEGIGIPPEYLPKVFDPFFTTKQSGSGLGLATSYSIVKNHKGYITLESRIGVGTTFYIYLPASEKEVPARPEIPPTHVNGSGKVLVMDDEEMVREVASQILTSIGYEVELATDGEEALALYEQSMQNGRPFDIIIMDLTIPGAMGGKETIQKLLKLDPDAKAVVASGYSSDPVMANYSRYGFKGCIKKPFTVDELGQVLSKINQNSSEARAKRVGS